MAFSIEDRNCAIDRLRNYDGRNPYMLGLRNSVISMQNVTSLTEFNIEYINKNWNFNPVQINKPAKLTDWLAKAKQTEFNIDFLPTKLYVTWLIGETSEFYHVYALYRRSMEAIQMFLPKSGVMNNLSIPDYTSLSVDFDRYDTLSTSKDPNRKLKEHQKDGVKFLLSRKKCILADDMGLGKTTTLSVAAIEGNFDSILIICPANLKINWMNELLWYVPQRDITIIGGFNGFTKGDFEKYLGYGLNKSGKTVPELKKEAEERGKWVDNRIVIINFDILDDVYQLSRARSEKGLEEALKNSPMLQYIKGKKSLIIVDEAHNLSNMQSNRYKITHDLIKKGNPHSIYLATGTPITNNPANYYCLLALLGEPIADNYEYYMEHYCQAIHVPRGAKQKEKRDRLQAKFLADHHASNWYDLSSEDKKKLNDYLKKNVVMSVIPKGGANLDELKERTAHIYLRRIKDDLINDDGDKLLPEKYIHEVYYDLTMEQLMEYNRLWDEYLENKAQDMFTEKNGALDIEFCRLKVKELADKGLLEGAIYRKYLSNLMVPNTIKWVEKCLLKNEKVVIACCYDEELYRLKEYFGDKALIYNGDITDPKKKEAIVQEFRTNPEKMIFIGNIKAAGVGITLIESRVMFFNNVDWVPGNNRQMEDRIYRIGQKRDVHIYYQFFRQTQYEKMWQTVIKKETEINQVIKKEDDK